jgi:stage II sporulation protein AA (anti-sigma F factor antagonist)
MNVKVSSAGDFTVVGVEGRIDTTNAAGFELKLMELVDAGASKILLDCSGLSYISSSGLRVFLVVQKKMGALKGQLRICNLQPVIKEIFDISGFSTIFSVFADRDSAVKG